MEMIDGVMVSMWWLPVLWISTLELHIETAHNTQRRTLHYATFLSFFPIVKTRRSFHDQFYTDNPEARAPDIR